MGVLRKQLLANNYIYSCLRQLYTAQYRSSKHALQEEELTISINGKQYEKDSWTNFRGRVVNLINRDLHREKYNPICLIKQRIVNYFNKAFPNYRGNPLFALCDDLSPVVTMQQNFDSLLVPPDHPSRNKSDSYFINKDYMLRAHTSAHQSELIQSGLDCFLVAGDVYRRDQVDSTHFPVFHQMEGVRLFTEHQVSML